MTFGSSRCSSSPRVTWRTSGSASTRIRVTRAAAASGPGIRPRTWSSRIRSAAGVVAQDADQGVDGDRLADLHQLRLGLAAAVLRPEHDGLAEQPDPSGPRGLLGGRGGLDLAAVALLLGDPLALVADQPLRLADLVGGEPSAAGRHVAELPVRRGERLVPRHGRLIMEFGQVGQLVLLAPEAELVLRLGGHRRLGPEDHVLVQGAGLGDDVDDLGLLEGQGRLAPLGQHDDAVGMVRVGDRPCPGSGRPRAG